MSTSNKLKAFVRFDGSGRVVPSSVILARFKPKVGNYHEIDAYECCNEAPTTTTTTTQGGVTPTAWIAQIANSGISDQWKACNGLGFSLIVYTNSATEPLVPGTALYSDAALTTLIPYSFGSISINEIVYEVVGGYTNPLGGYGQPCAAITTTTTTTTSALTVGLSTLSCGTPVSFAPISFVLGSSTCDLDVVIAGDFSSLPEDFYVIYNGYSRYFFKLNNSLAQGAGGAPGECISCG
jgi:hypothetical protein